MKNKRAIYIAKTLKVGELDVINTILEDFNVQTKDQIFCSKYNYVLDQIKEDRISVRKNNVFLAEYLHFSKKESKRYYSKKIWKKGSFKIYVSHLHSSKLEAIILENELKKYGISCYLPRVNEVLSENWQDRSSKALESCDGLVVLLKKGISNSYKVNFEIGSAIGREIPIFQVVLNDSLPYGILKKQEIVRGLSFKDNAKNIFISLTENVNTREAIVSSLITMFENSDSFYEAKTNASFIEKNIYWNELLLKKLELSLKGNAQIGGSFGVLERIDLLVKKERAKLMKG